MRAVRVRTADASDLPDLMMIEQECFGIEKFSEETVRSFIERTDTFVVLATGSEGVVGSAMCMLSGERREGRIASIAVLPAFRRRGTGVHLLEACESRFSRRGLLMSTLEVDVANEAAIALYESKGYRTGGVVEDFYGPGRDAYVMGKALGTKRTGVRVRTS